MSEKEQKYRIATRCPQGLPKVHSGREWLGLIDDQNTGPFVEGLVIKQETLCVLKYVGGRRVLAFPLASPPAPALLTGLSEQDVALVNQYAEQYQAGEFNEAVEVERLGRLAMMI